MNKIYILLAAVVIGGVALVMLDDSPVPKTIDTLDDQKMNPKVLRNPAVQIERATIKTEQVQKSVVAKKAGTRQHKKKRRDPHIKYVTKDSRGRYVISVYDEVGDTRDSVETVNFAGKIDGSYFQVKIPASSKDDPLKLKFYDRKTKETKMIDIPFTNDLSAEMNNRVAIKIDSKSMENYEVQTVPETAMPFPQ